MTHRTMIAAELQASDFGQAYTQCGGLNMYAGAEPSPYLREYWKNELYT